MLVTWDFLHFALRQGRVRRDIKWRNLHTKCLLHKLKNQPQHNHQPLSVLGYKVMVVKNVLLKIIRLFLFEQNETLQRLIVMTQLKLFLWNTWKEKFNIDCMSECIIISFLYTLSIEIQVKKTVFSLKVLITYLCLCSDVIWRLPMKVKFAIAQPSSHTAYHFTHIIHILFILMTVPCLKTAPPF